MKSPAIYEYLDVHLYLKDVYQYRKKTEPAFSYEKWATEMNLRSRSYLRAVIIGEKPLHESILSSLVASLNLDNKQIDYFTLLFRYSLAPSEGLKESYGRQLIQQWKKALNQTDIKNIESFLSDSLIPVLFTYLSFADASSDPQIIMKALNCEPERLSHAMRSLVWHKLVDGHVDERGVIIYKTIQPYFHIPSTPQNLFLKQFHNDGLALAAKAIEKPTVERKFFSAFVAISADQLVQAQQLIEEFNQKLLAIYDSDELKEKKSIDLPLKFFRRREPTCLGRMMVRVRCVRR